MKEEVKPCCINFHRLLCAVTLVFSGLLFPLCSQLSIPALLFSWSCDCKVCLQVEQSSQSYPFVSAQLLDLLPLQFRKLELDLNPHFFLLLLFIAVTFCLVSTYIERHTRALLFLAWLEENGWVRGSGFVAISPNCGGKQIRSELKVQESAGAVATFWKGEGKSLLSRFAPPFHFLNQQRKQVCPNWRAKKKKIL